MTMTDADAQTLREIAEKIEAVVLDPEDGEAGIVEIYSGRVLGRFLSIRSASRALSADPQKWVNRALAASQEQRHV